MRTVRARTEKGRITAKDGAKLRSAGWRNVRFFDSVRGNGLAAPAPFRASGLDGHRLALSVDGFARGPQEDAVAELGAAIAAAIDGGDGKGRVLPLEVDPPATAHVAWTGSRLLRDGEDTGAYHVAVASRPWWPRSDAGTTTSGAASAQSARFPNDWHGVRYLGRRPLGDF